MAKPYSWTAPYERALAETDINQLHARVLEAEDAMLTRCLEIRRDDKSKEIQAELTALRAAADELLKVKTEKLGWRLS
jgi:hypothetical protein